MWIQIWDTLRTFITNLTDIIKNQAKNLNKHCSKNHTQTANEHTKRGLTSLSAGNANQNHSGKALHTHKGGHKQQQ